MEIWRTEKGATNKRSSIQEVHGPKQASTSNNPFGRLVYIDQKGKEENENEPTDIQLQLRQSKNSN